MDLEWNYAVPDDVSRAQFGKMAGARCHNSKYPARCYQPTYAMKCSLQVFCDACERAYSACVYLVSVNDDIVSSTLISYKCKVAPIKPLTSPRLELLAIHTGAILATAVKGALSKSKHAPNISVLYSDSTIALSWIKADPARWPTFLSNRVSQIQSMLPRPEFFHLSCAVRGESSRSVLTRNSSNAVGCSAEILV